jgi:hypothetical protein
MLLLLAAALFSWRRGDRCLFRAVSASYGRSICLFLVLPFAAGHMPSRSRRNRKCSFFFFAIADCGQTVGVCVDGWGFFACRVMCFGPTGGLPLLFFFILFALERAGVSRYCGSYGNGGGGTLLICDIWDSLSEMHVFLLGIWFRYMV